MVFFGLVGIGYLLYPDAGSQVIGYLPYTSLRTNSTSCVCAIIVSLWPA
jgi:hypothetical protein